MSGLMKTFAAVLTSLVLFSMAAIAQDSQTKTEPIKVKTELQTCRENLAVEQGVAEQLFAMVKNSEPQPKSVSSAELEKKYDELVEKFNANVREHNQLVADYNQLFAIAQQSVPARTPRSRVAAFAHGFSQSMAAQRQNQAQPVTCNTTTFGSTSTTNCY